MSGITDFGRIMSQVEGYFGQDIYSVLGPSIARKKKYVRLIFYVVEKISGTSAGNAALILLVILFYSKVRIPEGDKRVFQLSLSANNYRSLAHLNSILTPAGIADISLNGLPYPVATRLRLLLSMKAIRQAARILAQRGHANPFIHIQQAIGCASLLMFSRVLLENDKLRLVCVANDHAPACMALLEVARMNGIATCYIQHAPVSEHFPALAYDISVLFDRSSREAYEKAGRRHGARDHGKIVLLPPFKDRFRRPQLGSAPYRVGICLSFLPDLDALADIIGGLFRSEAVMSVRLRRHPRCRQDFSVLTSIDNVSIQPRGESLSAFFRDVDLVLVPNSGVAVESLHSGKVTLFTPGADMLVDDYYHYLEKGILPVFKPDLLEQPSKLRAFFDAAWEKRFSLMDETVRVPPECAEAHVIEAFKEILEGPDCQSS